ncbi:hypothetical protein IQ260_06985 [Leptolyngbya cf. ectocarpi LEGE 11479]|uniref:GEVED domain-containing protein n=1 Tax=Leptolyngbya cf. ectocarpi LEGE 11479 TaxID=1828722 RepID=A0A928X2K2_LEPEC|nr:GEVED domain-containing protein [Leptolyngbya ectocarpi]MBE9066394.1 hypothetical protein [Leptolyngbya cf. ectocarpi LEGE 11479]
MNKVARSIASLLVRACLLTPILILSPLVTSEAKAVSIVLDGSLTRLSGTDCGIATYRYGSSTTFDGKQIDLLVEVLSEDTESTSDGCININEGSISARIRDKDVGDTAASMDLKITVVEKGTTIPVEVDRLIMTGFDLDQSSGGHTGTDDIYLQAPDGVYISNNSEVTYSEGTFFGGRYQAKLKGTSASCDDDKDSVERECRGGAVFVTGDGGINKVSSVTVRVQNDNAYGRDNYTGSSNNNRRFDLSFEINDIEPIVNLNTDYGDAPNSYENARHSVSTNIALGSGLIPDHEVANQGSAAANGDDTDTTSVNYDDEDGVQLNGQPLDTQSLTAGVTTNLDIASFGTGYLSAWIDLDGDGNFTDADEQVVDDLLINSTTVENTAVPIAIPATATAGNSYMRFRFASAQGVGPTELSNSDGEVEDYAVAIAPLSTLPPFSCAVPSLIQTTTNQGQLRQFQIATQTFDATGFAPVGFNLNGLGYREQDNYLYGFNNSSPTRELYRVGSDGTAESLGAVAGAVQNFILGDVHPDGTYWAAPFDSTTLYHIDVTTSPPTLLNTFPNALPDDGSDFAFSADGTKLYIVGHQTNKLYEVDMTGATPVPNPTPIATISGIASGGWGAQFTTPTKFYAYDNFTGGVYVIDLATGLSELMVTAALFTFNDGTSCRGEIDFFDFGDAPTTSYGSVAHTLVPGSYLGTGRSIDATDYDSANADADTDDGVQLSGTNLQGETLTAGETVSLDITTAGGGVLNAWIDWDGDGDFDEPNEQVATDANISGGTLSVPVPSNATTGTTYARFRYSSDPGLGPTGSASDGEVEDYQVAIAQPVVTNPDIVLVKRITAINGNRTENTNSTPPTPLNAVINDGVASSADDENNWPASSYLIGELNAGLVKPGDRIEYTVYFLNTGSSDAETVRICDWIQPNQSLVTGLYGESSTGARDGTDIELNIGGTVYQLTAASDAADRAELTTAGSLSATPDCNLSASANASDSVLVLDITGTTGDPTGLTTLPGTTGQGTPTNAYGFFRFTTKVDE